MFSAKVSEVPVAGEEVQMADASPIGTPLPTFCINVFWLILLR